MLLTWLYFFVWIVPPKAKAMERVTMKFLAWRFWRKHLIFGCAGAEVAVLCITKSGEVLNYQAFTNSRGIYTVAETMPESDRWDACLARPISSFHEHCTQLGDGSSGVKFSYNHPPGYSHSVRPFVYRPIRVPMYCIWMLLCVYPNVIYKLVNEKYFLIILTRWKLNRREVIFLVICVCFLFGLLSQYCTVWSIRDLNPFQLQLLWRILQCAELSDLFCSFGK